MNKLWALVNKNASIWFINCDGFPTVVLQVPHRGIWVWNI